MEYLLVVNHFIPKSATRLTAGKAAHCDATHFMYFFFSNPSDQPTSVPDAKRAII
jgi:hypothetical protein